MHLKMTPKVYKQYRSENSQWIEGILRFQIQTVWTVEQSKT